MEHVFIVGIIFWVGFFSLLQFFYFFVMSKQTEKWLSVEGKINTSVVEINYGLPTERGAAYTANVQYQYIVGKKKYISKRIFFGDNIGKNFSRSVKKIVNKYAQKKTVLVYYNPKNPTKSVLEIGVHRNCNEIN